MPRSATALRRSVGPPDSAASGARTTHRSSIGCDRAERGCRGAVANLLATIFRSNCSRRTRDPSHIRCKDFGRDVDARADDPIPLDEPFHGVRVTRMLLQDVPHVATLHLQALPASFFSSLGPRFLRRYHESFVAGPDGIGFVATHQQRLCGFVIGSTAAASHSAWVVRRRGPRLAVSAFLAMLVRPRVLVHFLSSRGARYARGLYRRVRHQPLAQVADSPTSDQPAVLAHVAVHSAWRRIGLGEVLVRAFEREAQVRGARTIELVTLDGPEGAGQFYERLEYTKDRVRQDDEGRRWLYFRSTPRPG